MQHPMVYDFRISQTDKIISEAFRLYSEVLRNQKEVQRIHVNFTHGNETLDVTLKKGEKIDIDVPESPRNQAKLALILYSYGQLFLPVQNYGVFSKAASCEVTTKHATEHAGAMQKTLDRQINLYLEGLLAAKLKKTANNTSASEPLLDETSLADELQELEEKYDKANLQIDSQKRDIGALNREKHRLNRNLEYVRSTLANILNKIKQ